MEAGAGDRAWFDSHSHLQEQYLPDAGAAAGAGAGAGVAGPPGARVAGDAHAEVGGGEAPPLVDDRVAGSLERAWAAGVGRIVCVGTDAGTSAQAMALAAATRDGSFGAEVPRVWATAGLHPHEAATGSGEVTALVEAAQGGGALVAVGECGLDYYYEHSPRAAQRQAFAEQIALALRFDLALVIHARDAWSDLFDVLGHEGVPPRTVLHCFTGGPEEARRCLDLGLWISFSGIVTFKNAADVRAAAALCPLDRLLVETDSPFLAPVPHRGHPNEPAHVPLVGQAVASAKGVAVAEVAASSTRAAAEVFEVE